MAAARQGAGSKARRAERAREVKGGELAILLTQTAREAFEF
jgi:hypothetical protein